MICDDKLSSDTTRTRHAESCDHGSEHDPQGGLSRRDFVKTGAAGLVGGALAGHGLFAAGQPPGQDQGPGGGGPPGGPPDGVPGGPPVIPPGQQILLKGGVVLTMDPSIGDFEQADVLIQGSKILEVGPNIEAAARVIDARGMIVMPGFVDTHHHQYETIQRAIIADGLLAPPGGFGAPNAGWPLETYVSVVQAIWTTGRIGSASDPLWDLGRSPYDPEDCYISELVASVAGINEGITTGIDTSQSSHTPEHTDAMIQGLMDSGRRSLYVYAGGRSDQPGYEYPGEIGNEMSGLGRLRSQWFSSEDQLVTLGFTGGAGLWPLARHFGAQIVNHNFTGADLVANQGSLGPDMEMIHAVNFSEDAWQVCADNGVKISIAGPIEMQMGHGVPPYQQALDHGILPSLSADVDTNMAHDMFTQMRTAFTLQRMLVNEGTFDGPLLTCRQVLEMATIAGAAGAGLDHKVGTLTPGKEADIIMLNARAINTWPLNNAPGTVVTMMNSSNVDTVFIGGVLRKWKGRLVGVRVNKLLDEIEASRDRVLDRIQSEPIPVDGMNSAPGYTPSLLGSCCVDQSYDAIP